MMKTRFPKAALAASLGALMVGSALARSAAALPPVHASGSVAYLSGGIGQDEARAIERASRQWPLTLEFAVKEKQHAEFAADVTVAVRDAQGHTALATRAKGPFLLARLTPGAYTVDATFAGMALHRKVVIAHGHPAHAVFVWPTGTGETRS
jgi:hypothetical protein